MPIPKDDVVAKDPRTERLQPTEQPGPEFLISELLGQKPGQKIEFSFERGRSLHAFDVAWQRQNKALIEQLPHGTTVIVNIATGQHVTGRNGLEAIDEFERIFGLEAVGWAFEVGIPLNIGGGLWALSSEA